VASAVTGGTHDFVLVNFANPDMVGHTGSIPAAIDAVECVDSCLGRLIDLVAERAEWIALVTADHGNAEKMLDAAGNVHTAHTTEPVDLIIFDPASEVEALRNQGRLADVAPTVLALLSIPAPSQMTGSSLIESLAAGGQ
jgi:2,3-bisphosphoglycerate-independent phosphoglycerate mutase